MLSEWQGQTCQHRSDDFPLIADVICAHRPPLVVELGTDAGGFACFLADTVAEWGGHVVTVDIVRKCGDLGRSNLRMLTLDCLARQQTEIVSLIERPGTLLYCDNGNKMRELELYAPRLGPGGLLGVHDYGTEVDPESAEQMLARMGYEPYRHGEFEALANEWYPSLTRFWTRRFVSLGEQS